LLSGKVTLRGVLLWIAETYLWKWEVTKVPTW